MATAEKTKADAQVVPSGKYRDGSEVNELVARADFQGLQLSAMIDAIPTGGGDELSFLESILKAESVDQLDAAWGELGGMERFFGSVITIHSVRKMPSKYGEGLGWYFVLDVTQAGGDVVHTVGTGATSVMAQIIKAWHLGAFPLTVIPRQSDPNPVTGFQAQHLEIVKV